MSELQRLEEIKQFLEIVKASNYNRVQNMIDDYNLGSDMLQIMYDLIFKNDDITDEEGHQLSQELIDQLNRLGIEP